MTDLDLIYEEVVINCERHGQQFDKLLRSVGGVDFKRKRATECPVCREERIAEERASARAREHAERTARMITLSGITPRHGKFSFDDFATTTKAQERVLTLAKRYAKAVADKMHTGSWLVLTGPPGTGKTMLAGSIIRDLADRGIRAKYITVSALGREFRRSYQRDAEVSEPQLFDSLVKVPLLILDEVAASGTEHTDRLLFEIADARYGQGMPLLLISNHPRNDLEGLLGERLADRLAETAVWCAMDWPSHRQRGNRAA